MKTPKPPSREALQAQCDAFNFDCEVGGRVALNRDGTSKPFITTTRTTAQILGGHTAVVWLEGISGCYGLSHVTPIPVEVSEEAAWVVLADSGNVIFWSRDRAKVEEAAAKHGRPFGPYSPGVRDIAEINGCRTVPRLPTSRQLRHAERHAPPELAKAIYLTMTARDATAPDEYWQRIVMPGQVREGDRLRFTIGDKHFTERAKLILNPGTATEEVVYDKGKNFYFITSMVTSGTSNHKNVEVAIKNPD